jgi:carbonic anhydrase/acetyltransferase-like protein (isoleucine patch superfamily)
MESIRPFNGKSPTVARDSWIDPTATLIGEVEVGSGASIWPMTVIRGDIHSIHIGARSNIQDGSVLHVTHASEFNPGGFPLVIEEDVTVGHKVTLHGCTIRSHCLIGMGAIILDGAVVGSDTMIAAGSLVPPGKTLEGGFLWRGSPARKARPLSDDELRRIRYITANYVRLGAQYREEQMATPAAD